MKTINVTQDDIDAGIRRSHICCPIALACKREFKDNFEEVNTFQIIFKSGSSINLPQLAFNFVHSFDTGLDVVPFSFEIDDNHLTF